MASAPDPSAHLQDPRPGSRPSGAQSRGLFAAQDGCREGFRRRAHRDPAAREGRARAGSQPRGAGARGVPLAG